MRVFLLAAAAVLLALPAQAQNVGGDPTFGDVRLTEGFTPDPHTVSLNAGGSVTPAPDGCAYGSIAEDPDVDLYFTADGSSTLYIWVDSSADTTLLINTAGGSWVCDDDDGPGTNPFIVLSGAGSGLYNIWVGTFGDATPSATLYISELDPR